MLSSFNPVSLGFCHDGRKLNVAWPPATLLEDVSDAAAVPRGDEKPRLRACWCGGIAGVRVPHFGWVTLGQPLFLPFKINRAYF